MEGKCMDLFNNKIIRRTNLYICNHFPIKELRKKLKKQNISILCNNCIDGFINHDLGLCYNAPTVNMFFYSLDFFDFVEYFDYYIRQLLIQIENLRYDPNAPDYPDAILSGGGTTKI